MSTQPSMLEGAVNRYLTTVLDVHCRGERSTDSRQRARRCDTSRVPSRLSMQSGDFEVIFRWQLPRGRVTIGQSDDASNFSLQRRNSFISLYIFHFWLFSCSAIHCVTRYYSGRQVLIVSLLNLRFRILLYSPPSLLPTCLPLQQSPSRHTKKTKRLFASMASFYTRRKC